MRITIALAGFAIVALIAFLLGKRHARRFQRAQRIHIDRFKLKRRHADIELEVFGSRAVVDAVREYARSHHVSTEEAAGKARMYLREIVPKFNLLAYYRIGAPLARAIMHFLYRPVVERNPLRDFSEKAPKNAVVVYLINHRSNADYVLVAHMLFKFVSLSYAIGEWARVWPLNHVFKWFGGYFVRRRYREPLYHAVLSTFVQTITRNGVTQGIFIEGGLSRDGAFQRPKLGMLDYIVTAKRDPSFTAPLFFIPTAINYDRVLEDRNLTEELLGREDRSTKTEKLNTTLGFLFKNTLRSAFKRFKRYGYAIVTFGKPISVDDFIAAHPDVLAEEFEERKQSLQLLAENTMREIAAALPITPVPLVARLFREHELLSEREIVAGIGAHMERRTPPSARAATAALTREPEADEGVRRSSTWLLREKTPEEVWRAARHVLELRHLIVPGERWRSDLFDESGVPVIEDVWRWNPDEVILRDYYANSLLTFDEVKFRGWPERKPRIGEALDAGASTHVSTA